MNIVCNSKALVNLIDVFKNMMILLQILSPILLIIFLSIGFINAARNPEEKKNKVIAAIMVFFVPIIVNALMFILGEKTEFSSCWNNVKAIKSFSNYISISEGRKKYNIIEDASNYEKGTPKYGDARSVAELAVRVAPVANPNGGIKGDAWLGHGVDRASVDQRMHDYIKIMDATVTAHLSDKSNPNYHIGYNNPANCSWDQAAAAILRAAADPDFDSYDNCSQKDYIEKHPEKWTIVGVVKAGQNFDDYCEPGDLLIAGELNSSGACVNAHTMIYVGNELARTKFPNTRGNIFQASYNPSTGGANSTCPAIDYYPTDRRDFTIYRPTGKGESYYPKIDIDKVLASKMQTGPFW